MDREGLTKVLRSKRVGHRRAAPLRRNTDYRGDGNISRPKTDEYGISDGKAAASFDFLNYFLSSLLSNQFLKFGKKKKKK